MHTIEFTDEALEVIDKMKREVGEIGRLLGEGDELYAKSASSLMYSLIQMFALRPKQVFRDGELSLVCYTNHITFGVNVHYQEVVVYGVKVRVPTWSVNS